MGKDDAEPRSFEATPKAESDQSDGPHTPVHIDDACFTSSVWINRGAQNFPGQVTL